MLLPLSSAEDAIDAEDSSMQLHPGYEVNLRYTVSQRKTSENFNRLENRHCRFRDEMLGGNTPFKKYSRKACVYHCATLRSAE